MLKLTGSWVTGSEQAAKAMHHDRVVCIEADGNTAAAVPVISVSSGKGGVGKTVLAANLARLLSWSGNKVLLVDLDLHNRGSTALIADQVTKEHATVADLLEFADPQRASDLAGAIERANLIEAPGPSHTLYLLPSIRYHHEALGREYKHEVEELKAFFKHLLSELIRRYGFQCVIFDCASGPEPLFLAAAGLSTDILLITEADMVTWAGNVNLFNHLYEHYRKDADTLLNVQFVLNRVPERYDLAELKQVYERRLSRFLKGRRILAAIPFDYEVFQAFTQCTFFVDEMRTSPLVRRIAAIADELFGTSHPELLTDEAKTLASVRPRPLLRSGFGGRPLWAKIFLLLGTFYAVAGSIVLRATSGGVAWQAGLVVLATGVLALLFGGLYRAKFLQ